jgi:RNA polymerase sigma factor (sigma-70 family)
MRGVRIEASQRERFRALYEANYAAILGYALRRAPRDDAADVVAETFLTAWRRLRDVPDGENARLWLYATARRVLANRARSERRRSRLAVVVERAAQIPPPEPVPAETDAVAAAFNGLRPEERELLGLVAWEGLSTAEIARVLGCSPNAVRIRLHRARRRFEGELEDSAPDIARAGLGRTA